MKQISKVEGRKAAKRVQSFGAGLQIHQIVQGRVTEVIIYGTRTVVLYQASGKYHLFCAML
jgi:hypothetical protein